MSIFFYFDILQVGFLLEMIFYEVVFVWVLKLGIRVWLFIKYVVLFVVVVVVVFLVNGLFEVYFYYCEYKVLLIWVQYEQVEVVVVKIGQFVKEIESQFGWIM